MPVALFTLGGTIAMAGTTADERGGPVVTSLTGTDAPYKARVLLRVLVEGGVGSEGGC